MNDKPENISAELVEWVALCLTPRIGAKILQNLLAQFGTPAGVLAAPADELRSVVGVGTQMATTIRQINLSSVEKRLRNWLNAGIQVWTWHDADYPLMLKKVDDRPPLLFAKGNWHSSSTRTLAIIGTRQPSPIALEITSRLAVLCAMGGWTVVSGLAIGIDATAHHNALKSGSSVAILGSGLFDIYPLQNRRLAERIVRQGSLLSEVAPESAASTSQLIARNRIISGLSQVVVVIESNKDSGALHAARFARQQRRRIFTLDLPAEGNQKLKNEGAVFIAPNQSGITQLVEMIEAGGN